MVKADIRFEDIKKTIKRLPIKEREKLLREFQKDFSKMRMKGILTNIKKRRAKLSLTDKEITEEIEKARQEFYDRHR